MNTTPTKIFDVLGLGCAAVDDVIYVPTFPRADEKLRVGRRERRFGGLTAAALIAAARLGARCAYAGCLGNDELGQAVKANLESERIDLTHVPYSMNARVVYAIIIVGEQSGTRNIFFDADNVLGAHPGLPEAAVIRASKVLFVDQYGMEGNLRAIKIAADAGVPVVADFEDASAPGFADVFDLVNHVILSAEFALPLTGASSAASAAQALWGTRRDAVVITNGTCGCWAIGKDGNAQLRHYEAFPVKTTDSTGCGDVFHGAYAAALAEGKSLSERIRVASAAAALRASTPEIPRRKDVDQFLKERIETKPHELKVS